MTYTIKQEFIDVGGGHALDVYSYGNPEGAPIFILHGGPGSGAKVKHFAFFDPGRTG